MQTCLWLSGRALQVFINIFSLTSQVYS